MKTILFTTLITILLIAGGVLYLKNDSKDENTNEKCCVTCSKENEVKYYSIASNDNCGESCLNPKLFWLYKIFETNLTLAEDTTCGSLGYTEYIVTETHGVFPVKATLDRYKKPS